MIIRNARLDLVPEGERVDLVLDDTRITDITAVDGHRQADLDCHGAFVCAPFVDAHTHLDAVMLAAGAEVNPEGTLAGGIAAWGEAKQRLTAPDVRARALAAIRRCVAYGTGTIRSHVDICDPSLVAVHALLELRAEVEPLIELKLIAFPQDGLVDYPHGQDLMCEALEAGCDAIGGSPHLEWTETAGLEQVKLLFELAHRYRLPIDAHCDETDDEHSRFVAEFARLARTLDTPVTVSHVTAMAAYPGPYLHKIIGLLAAARVTVVANPLTNLTLGGRHDQYPIRRALAPLKELMAAGVNVSLGQDCMQDPWYPLGTGSMLDVVWLAVHAGLLTTRHELALLFSALLRDPDRPGMRRRIEPGAPSDLLVFDCSNVVDIVRRRPRPRAVIRHGRVICESDDRGAVIKTTTGDVKVQL